MIPKFAVASKFMTMDEIEGALRLEVDIIDVEKQAEGKEDSVPSLHASPSQESPDLPWECRSDAFALRWGRRL